SGEPWWDRTTDPSFKSPLYAVTSRQRPSHLGDSNSSATQTATQRCDCRQRTTEFAYFVPFVSEFAGACFSAICPRTVIVSPYLGWGWRGGVRDAGWSGDCHRRRL